jgi:hypothetical protein
MVHNKIYSFIICFFTLFDTNASSNISDFLIKQQMVHELAQNKSFMQCINKQLIDENITNKHAILLKQVGVGHDLKLALSLTSSLIQSFIEVSRSVSEKVHLYDVSSLANYDKADYESVHVITTTLAGFENGGKLDGDGVAVYSKYISLGGGKDYDHSLLSVDFYTSTDSGRILDGFSLASVIDSIDKSKDASLGGSSFSVVFNRESYNNPSRVLAEKVLLIHASVKLIESIFNIKFDCTYKPSEASRRAKQTTIVNNNSTAYGAMEVIEITAKIPTFIKSKKYYFPKSNSRYFKCRRLSCKIKFNGKMNPEIAAYVEEAMDNAFPYDNDVNISCEIENEKLKCFASGNIKGFSKRKMKRYLYGS